MKQGWAFAWRSLMAAEIFVTILTGFGLGHLLQYGRELSAMDQVIGVMVVIVVIGLIADKIALLAVGAIPASPLGNGIEIRPAEAACRLSVGAPTVRRSIMGPRPTGRLHVASGRETRWYAGDAERRSVRVGGPARS